MPSPFSDLRDRYASFARAVQYVQYNTCISYPDSHILSCMPQSSQSSLASGTRTGTVVSRENIRTAWLSYQEAVKKEAKTCKLIYLRISLNLDDGERETLGILTNQALEGAMRPVNLTVQPWWQDRIREKAAMKPVIDLLESLLSYSESSSQLRVSQQAGRSSNDEDGDRVGADLDFELQRQKTEGLPPLEGSPTIELKRFYSIDTASGGIKDL